MFVYADVYILDAGWFAQMMYESNWTIDNPKVIAEFYRPGDISFYTSHFSPIFYVLSLIRKGISLVYDVNVIQYFAWFQGACHSIIALLYFNLVKNILPDNKWANTYAFLLAFLFSINHLFANMISYPHYEIAGAALLAVCLYCLIKEWSILGFIFLILACSIREDMGVHSAAILGLWFLYERWKWNRFNYTLLYCSIVAFMFTILGLYVKSEFPSIGHNLMHTYVTGNLEDNFRMDLVWNRLHMFFTKNSFISWPLLLIMLLAWRQKNWFLALGVFSCIPWFLINIFAASPCAGNFGTYVAYPFVTAFIWPLLAMAYTINIKKETYAPSYKNWVVLLQVLIILATSLTARSKVYGPFCQWVPQAILSDYGTLFENPKLLDELGEYKVSEAVMLLHPNAFKTSQDINIKKIEELESLPTNDSVVLAPGFLLLHPESPWQADLYFAQHRPYYYQFLNTRIRIATNKTITEMPTLGSHLKPANFFLDQIKTLRGTILSPTQIKLQGKKDEIILETTFMVLPKGNFTLRLPLESIEKETIGILKIINRQDGKVLHTCKISPENSKCLLSLESITKTIIQLQSTTRESIIISNPTLVMD